MKDNKFRKEFNELFSSSELMFLLQEATWVGENENEEIDHLFFARDKGMVEISLPIHRIDSKDVEILFVTTTDRTRYIKKEFMQFIYNSRRKELSVISVD